MSTGTEKFFNSLRTRQMKYGGYASLVTLGVIAVLILINLVFTRFSPQADLTDNKRFSLSDETLQVIGSIKSPVVIYGLWRPGEENREVAEVLDLYLARSGMIRMDLVDPDRNPGFVARYDKNNEGIDRGSVLVEGEKGFKIISSDDMYDTGVAIEKRLTAALLFAGSGETPVIYEISGHGEPALDELGLKAAIERENYALRALNLLQSEIPADTSALILNCPRTDLSGDETEKILGYLGKGGRLLMVMDIMTRELTNLNDMLSSYGIQYDYGIVMEGDARRRAGDNPFFIIPGMGDHPIVGPLAEKQLPVIFPNSIGLSELDAKRRTIKAAPFLSASEQSFLRRDLNNSNPAGGSGDDPGPVTVAMAVEDPEYPGTGEGQARIVALGSGSLGYSQRGALNFYQQSPGNMDLFLNSLTWLEDRPETLSVRSKSLYLLPMRMNGFLFVVFGLLFVILIPLGFFIAGLVVWLRRRHL
ncbi:MAG: GldG family protein [Treponema sp.]|nr:GldG family protein [Treponema sp.]